MPKDVKCRNCVNLRYEWCEKVYDSPYPDLLRDCSHFCQKTNGDCVRAMNDRELAAFMAKHDAEQTFLRLEGNGIVPNATQRVVLVETLFKTWIRWMTEPASEKGGAADAG